MADEQIPKMKNETPGTTPGQHRPARDIVNPPAPDTTGAGGSAPDGPTNGDAPNNGKQKPFARDANGPASPKQQSKGTKAEKGAKGEKGEKQPGRSAGSARDSVGGGESKEDRQRRRAAAAGAAAAKAAKGTKDDERLAAGLGEDLADMKNAQGLGNKARAAQNAAEKGARMVASKKTGGASEKVLNTKAGQATLKVFKAVAAAQALLPVVLLAFVVLVGAALIAAIAGNKGIEGDYGYTLDSEHPMAIEEPYFDAYREAAANFDVPWTVLAGIGQVATEHGRYAPSDISDYGMLVDRAPYRAPIGSVPGSAAPGKAAPPIGSQIVLLGDSLVAGGEPPLVKALDAYEVSSAGTNGATIDSIKSGVLGAVAQSAPVVIIQAGVNDVYHQTGEAAYRADMVEIFTAAAGRSCVVWVNLQAFYGESYATLGPLAQRFNQVLAEEAATRQGVVVADLATATAVAGMQAPDGLHLSSAGYRAWAGTVSRAVLEGCGATQLAAATAGPQDAAPTIVPVSSGRTTAAGQPVRTDRSYSAYVCDGGICGPYPRMGEAEGSAIGPLQLQRDWVAKNADGRAPDDIKDASYLLAKELARIRDAAVEGPAGELFEGWRNDPAVARDLWSYVIANAPVVLPNRASATPTACAAGPLAGPQGAALAWPLPDTQARTEFGAAADGTDQVQVSGMRLAGSGRVVLAAGAGTVADVGTDTDGAYVVIAHGDGFSTKYAGLTATSVAIGATVSQGAQVGSFTDTIRFETTVGNSPRNPRLYVNNASALPLATGVAVDPQAGTDSTDPQAGVPIDPCTGLRVVAAAAPAVSPTGVAVPQSLVVPVAGVAASQLRDSFGDPRSGGRSHQGIDIVVPVGTPLVAVTSGTVRSNTAGGVPCPTTGDPGRGVSILGDDGNQYYYGHMDVVSVAKDQRVSPGQLIGTVGETGNACVSVPHLHFSINENTDKVVNPYPILSGARSLRVEDFAGTLGGSALAALQGSAALNGAADFAVGFASFYGGIVPSDPNAGSFPGGGAGFTAPPSGPSSAELAATAPEMAAIIRLYFPPAQWDNAIRIANCESRLNPGSIGTNDNGTRDYGLFQFNDGGTLQGWLRTTGEDPTNIAKALDPHWAARAAAMKVARDGNWGQWSCAHTPYGKRTYGLSIVSLSPKEVETGKMDYSWQESGPGDTSISYQPV